MGHRMSALPIARFCPRAQDFDTGSGRAAVVSSAWHAKCSGAPDAEQQLLRLSDEERKEVEKWGKPTPVIVEDAYETHLDYELAEKELEVGLDAWGHYCNPKSPSCISVGHLDFAWVVSRPDGMRVAYVGDLKKREGTTEDGPYSLQLQAYGIAYASLRDCDAYICGIWAGEENTWTWMKEFVDLDSSESVDIWLKVKAAILNTEGDFCRGVHCHGCYSRFQCPAHVLPPEAAIGTLAILDGKTEITADKATELVLAIKRARDTIDKAEEYMKAWAEAHPGQIRDGGKVWTAKRYEGNEYLDKDALFKEMPEAARFLKQGKSYVRFTWLKEKAND